jgi:hypothetical protein
LILAGEQSGSLTHIAATERFVVRAYEKLTAFLELESAIRGVSSCNQDESSLGCLGASGESQNDFLSGFFCCGNENGNHE